MITYTNQINTVIDKVANILGDELSVPITFNEHSGNHSILIVPESDNIVDLMARGQLREYSILISYELSIATMSENIFKQVSNMAEHIKRLFARDNNGVVDGYWFNGQIASVVYEREDGKIRSLLNFNCNVAETS